MKCYIKMLYTTPLREVDENFFLTIITSSSLVNDVHLFVRGNVLYFVLLFDYSYHVLGALSDAPLTEEQLYFECSQVF